MSGEPSARDALAARLLEHTTRGIDRLSVEVAGEHVTLWLRQGRLRESCTCGSEGCEHVAAALAFLLQDEPLARSGELSLRAPARAASLADAASLGAIADALDELCLATVRAGLAVPESPSLRQALEQLLAAVPSPTPRAVARWVGRFRAALVAGDLGETARLLDGAAQWRDMLRAQDDTTAAVEARRAWLGTVDPSGASALADVTLLEVAREWVAGLDRAALERRYLLDLTSGDTYVEQRLRGETAISVGSCPRLAHVAFAEIEPGLQPPGVRLLQYTLSLPSGEASWQRVVQLAQTEVATVRELFTAALARSPALAEPFVVFAPHQRDAGPDGALRDQRGERIALDDEHGGLAVDELSTVTAGAELMCVLGRLLGRPTGLALRPLSVIVRRGAWLELRRVT